MIIKQCLIVFLLFKLTSSEIESCDSDFDDKCFFGPYLNKRYKLTASEGFDDVMVALGVPFFKRKIGNVVKPLLYLTSDGDYYTFTSETKFQTTSATFKLGEEFEEKTPDGRWVMSTVTQDRNKLIYVQDGEPKTSYTIYEFTPNQVDVVLTVEDIVCQRTYTAV